MICSDKKLGGHLALIECSSKGFFELDSKGDFVLTSKGAEELLSWCEEVVLGKRLARKVPRGELYKLLTVFRQAVREGRGSGYVAMNREGADSIPVKLSVVPLVEDGVITGFQCLIEAAAKDSYGLEALISPLGYELSSTLTVAKGALELALSEAEWRGNFLELGRNALIRQRRILMNLMDAFKLHEMDSNLYLTRVDLRELVRSVVGEMRKVYEGKGLGVEVDLPGDIPMVNADAEKIRNVLYTLLDYALMTWKKTVKISAAGRGGFLEVRVARNGEEGAMPAELPFLPSGGIRVGLEIAAGIVRAHGGRLTARNQGAMICFTLPAGPGQVT